jgi:capsular exopolysaccharide synthesis family protein
MMNNRSDSGGYDQPSPSNLPAIVAPGGGGMARRSGGSGQGPFTPDEDKGADFGRYLAAVRRYRYWVVLTTVVGFAGAVGATRLLKPQFAAQATLWVETSSREDASRGPIQPDQLLAAQGWVDLLRSYVVLDDVVRQMRLYVQPDREADSSTFAGFAIDNQFLPGEYRLSVDATGREFVLTAKGGVVVQRGAVGDSVGRGIGFLWAPRASALPPNHSIQFMVLQPRDAATRLANDLGMRIDQNGNFLRIFLTGTDPGRIAATVNAVAQREVDVAAELKKAKLIELTKILNAQLLSAERNLHSAEDALESFRVRTVTMPSDRGTALAPGLTITRDPVNSQFFDMKIQREQMRRDREAIERALAQVADSGLSVDALTVVPSVQQSPDLRKALDELTTAQADLRALRYKYTDAALPVQQRARQVDSLQLKTIPMLAHALVAQISARERALDVQVSNASEDMRSIPVRTIEESRLERAKTIAENLYTTLQQRYEEARLAEASSIPDVRVLDAAVTPEAPISNTAPRILLLGLVGGLCLGVLVAVMLDRFDPRVRYPDQITHDLGLPILGTLPRVNGKKNGKGAVETAHVLESLRSIRLNLTHAYGAAGPLLITITSPGSGDGKSFLCSNLAITFADSGYQTVLIDGDLRRGGLHRLLNATRKPGLTDYLSGEATREAVLQSTAYPALSFIGGGTRKPTAPELLGSPKMMELIASLRASHSVILIDSPPLGAAVDPFLLATVSGNLMLVMRTGATDRELAKAKLEMIDRLPVRILGAVLNDVKAEGVYRYYGYLDGYDMEPEHADAAPEPRKRIPGTVPR